MESESEVILSLDPNGNFIIKIVIDNRRSRWVISFAISTVATRWPIPGDGMKTSSVCFITNRRLLQREKNIGCFEGFVVRWHILVAEWVINDLSIVLAGEEPMSWLCWFSLFYSTSRFSMIWGCPLSKFEATVGGSGFPSV